MRFYVPRLLPCNQKHAFPGSITRNPNLKKLCQQPQQLSEFHSEALSPNAFPLPHTLRSRNDLAKGLRNLNQRRNQHASVQGSGFRVEPQSPVAALHTPEAVHPILDPPKTSHETISSSRRLGSNSSGRRPLCAEWPLASSPGCVWIFL